MPPKPNLDLLRALAITLVVVDHTILSKGVERVGPWYVGDVGLFGVYLFFVHTSLVLMWSLERRPNVLDFYIRRGFRIYPLAVLTILVAAFTHAPVAGLANHYFHAAAYTARILLANCFLVTELLPSIPPGTFIHGVTWSLGPEVYMYVLLPALFFYARSVRKVWPLLAIWGLLAAYVHRQDISSGFGNSFAELIPDFLSGVIAYVGFLRRRPTLPWWTLPLLLALLFVVYMRFHGVRFDWIVCLVLGLALPSFRQLNGRRTRNAAHAVATYSYGLYLIHPLAIVLGMYVLRGRPLALQLTVLLSSLTAASLLAYHLIERPMIEFGARLAARLAHERGVPSLQSLENLEPAP